MDASKMGRGPNCKSASQCRQERISRNEYESDWDLDAWMGNTETVYLDVGSEQDSDTFTGDDDGDLEDSSVEAKGTGVKSVSLYVGGGMTIQMLDSVTLALPDEQSIKFSRGLAKARVGGLTYDVKYRFIVENDTATLPIVKVFIEDDTSTWQEVFDQAAVTGLQNNSYFQTEVEGAVSKDWLKGSGAAKYFNIKVELWNSTDTAKLDDDTGTAYID